MLEPTLHRPGTDSLVSRGSIEVGLRGKRSARRISVSKNPCRDTNAFRSGGKLSLWQTLYISGVECLDLDVSNAEILSYQANVDGDTYRQVTHAVTGRMALTVNHPILSKQSRSFENSVVFQIRVSLMECSERRCS